MSRLSFNFDLGKTGAFATGAVVAVLALAVGVAFASDGQAIHACVDGKGKVIIVDGPADCKKGEEFLEWKIQGEPGPSGQDGGSCAIVPGLPDTTILCDDGSEAVISDGQDGADGAPGPPGQDATAPSGAVMFFSAVSCPSGWTEFTAARGRVFVALPSSGTPGETVGTALTDAEDRSHNHSVDPAAVGSSTAPQHAHQVDPPTTMSSNNGTHQHRWSSFNGATGTWRSGNDTFIIDWTNGIDNEGSGYFPLATQITGAITVNYNTSTAANHFHTTNIGTVVSNQNGAHGHLVDAPSAVSSNATTGSVLPYVQLLACEKD